MLSEPSPRRLSARVREVLPSRSSPIFFYKTAALSFPAAAAQLLCHKVLEQVADRGLGRGEIVLFSEKTLGGGSAVAQAFGALRKALCRTPDAQLELLACEYARPHSDTSFAGTGFVSTVLHTGPEPYVVDVFTVTGGRTRGFEVNAKARLLGKGDTFVLDPKVAHSAMPVRPHNDSLLILAQQEVRLEGPADYLSAMELFPRADDDKDVSNNLDWT